MTTPLRPDLSRILPQPWVQRLAPTEPPFRAAMTTPQTPSADYLVDVRPPPTTNDADSPGFGLAQATAVATRVQSRLRDVPSRGSLHRLDAERSAGLLAQFEWHAEPTSLLAQGPAPTATVRAASPVGATRSPR